MITEKDMEYIVGKDWKSTFIGESEEEIGFQKGIIAEHGLVKKRYQEVIQEKEKQHDFQENHKDDPRI